MKAKILFPLVALTLVVVMVIYFLLNPSYEKSLEAKYYYEMGEYQKAYELANEAFSMDVYNRMASTIMAQSKTSMKYQKYVNQAKEYLREINAIASKSTISDADRAKIKMMSEIMVDSYVKLAPSVITDEELVKEAASYYKNFEQLLEKVNR
jgi:tetratricopeptide (TPR) repeat protein